MSVDFPRAWQLAKKKRFEKHHSECSYRVTNGALLCDCAVLTKHPEYLRETVLYGKDGRPLCLLIKGDRNDSKQEW